MSKFEILKQLEYLVAFQTNCLMERNWEDFDRVENQIQELEKEILHPDTQGNNQVFD